MSPRRLIIVAASAVIAMGLLTAIGARAAPLPGDDTHPRVVPPAGGKATDYALRLTARADLGTHGPITSSYAVSIALPHRSGCAVALRITAGSSGQRLTERLTGPRRRTWCRGDYRGHVVLERGPHCPKPSTAPCPKLASQRVQAGRFRFRVT